MKAHHRFGLGPAVGMATLAIFAGAMAGCAAREGQPAMAGEAAVENERPMTPSASSAEAKAPEQLSASTIQLVVRDYFDRFRGCYEAGLARDPKLGGRVVLQFSIESSGRVGAAEVVEGPPSEVPKLSDREVLDCILAACRGIEFPAFASGEMTIVYPIVLSPDEGG